MSIKNIAIAMLVMYALFSPVLIMESDKEAFNRGFVVAMAINNAPQESPMYHYHVGDIIKGNRQYFINFNESLFVGKIKFIGSDGVLIINGITNTDLELHDMVINEYWTEPIPKSGYGINRNVVWTNISKGD